MLPVGYLSSGGVPGRLNSALSAEHKAAMAAAVATAPGKHLHRLQQRRGGRERQRATPIPAIEGKASPSATTDWEWGGCGDNVNYGVRKSREWMDALYRKRSDIKTLVMLHNNDAGRLVSMGECCTV